MYIKVETKRYLFVIVLACKKLWSVIDVFAKQKIKRFAKELKDEITSTGFKVMELSYFITSLFSFIALSRIFSNLVSFHEKSNKSKVKGQLFNELEVNNILNIFYLIFRLEIPLIKHFNVPFGNSSLLISKNLGTVCS
jgi:hypothetical protein